METEKYNAEKVAKAIRDMAPNLFYAKIVVRDAGDATRFFLTIDDDQPFTISVQDGELMRP